MHTSVTQWEATVTSRSNLPGQAELVLKDKPESLAKLKAAEPLRPELSQKPCDHGLFGDTAQQIDLEDLLK